MEKNTQIQKYIKQPYPITAMQANLSRQQIRILVGMMQQIQSRIQDFLSNKKPSGQLSLFDDIDSNYVNIEFKLGDVCDRPDYYKDTEEVAKKFMDIVFRYENKEMGEVTLTHFVDSVTIPKKGKYREGRVCFTFTKEQAMQVFDLTMFSKYIKSSVFSAESKYTARLYMLFSTYRGTEKDGVFHCYITYNELRRILGCDEKKGGKWHRENQKNYRDFKRNILKIAQEEMAAMSAEGKCDCQFEYKELPEGRRGEPESFDFVIRLNEIGRLESSKAEAKKAEMDLREVLKGELKLTDRECSRLLDGVELDDMPYLRERAMQIAEAIRKKGDAIKEAKAYAKKSMSEAIKDLADKRHTEQAQATPAPASEPQETHKVVKLYSDEDAKLFQQIKDNALNEADNKTIADYLPEVHLYEVTADSVTIEVPSRAFHETFVHYFGGGLFSKIKETFSRDANIVYANR